MAVSDEESSDFELEPSLKYLLESDEIKWIFVGGKGGVGKTTTSCSLSIQLAKVHESVLIISTDPAHNLSDAFGQQFGKTETKINGFDNLYAMEIDPEIDMSGQDDFLGVAKQTNFLKELSSSIPGIDEAFAFAELMKRVGAKNHSVIVFDTAPTGHTLRLLSFPSTLEKAFVKMNSLREKLGGMLSQAATLLSGMGQGLPSQESMAEKFKQLQESVKQVKERFQNPDMTTFVSVCIPEFLSLYETERLVQTLAKFGIDCHNIVINQVLHPVKFKTPPDVTGTLKTVCDRHVSRVSMQQKYIQQFKDLYEDYHLVQVPLLNQEVRRVERLEEYGLLLREPFVPPDLQKELNDKEEELELD